MDIKALTHEDVLNILPDRKNESHKGDYGKILLICGSKGYTGAAYLAAMGALRSGAGLVYLGVPESIYAIEAMKLTEPIIVPLPDKNGMLSEDAVTQISSLIEKVDAILIGPGIGRSSGVSSIVQYILQTFQGPVVLDADGINVIAEHKMILRERTGPTVVTPHEGEFLRLGGKLTGDRIEDAERLAEALDVTVVLKGYETVITDASVCYINHTGNPGMAVGGSGDMLCGMIAGLIGQGVGIMESASCAVWLHGAAGDICAKQLGQYGMLPTDMLNVLPRLLK